MPQPARHEQFYWDAWRNLSADRQSGMGIGAIPFLAIDAYAKRFDIEGRDFEDFFYIIRELDDAFIAVMNKKAEKDSKSAK